MSKKPKPAERSHYLQRISHETRKLIEALAKANGRTVPKEIEMIVKAAAKAQGIEP